MTEVTVRRARRGDAEAVRSFTGRGATWPDQERDDYLPDVVDEWIAGDGPDQQTVVAAVDGTVAGICQGVCLTDHEAWFQGLRVDPGYRGQGLGLAMLTDLQGWAYRRGRTVGRAMVFSWNAAGLGQTRAAGFDTGVEARWAQPDPDPDATVPGAYRVSPDPDAAWTCWQRSEARDALGGLGVDPDESWAVSEVTRDRLHRLDGEQAVLTVQDAAGTRAMTARVRTAERDVEGGTETWAVYGPAAWQSAGAAEALLAAIARDAGEVGADKVRALIPETAETVSDVAAARAGISDQPLFVMETDLTGGSQVEA